MFIWVSAYFSDDDANNCQIAVRLEIMYEYIKLSQHSKTQ